MEHLIPEVMGVVFRLAIRFWAKDDKVSDNFIDMEEFAQKCGLSMWDARKFRRAVDNFIDTMSENFIKEYGRQIESESRKRAIFLQIQKDIEKSGFNERKLIKTLSKPEELCRIIMARSEKERKEWSEAEDALYSSCIKYISKASVEFVSKLPTFARETLKVVIERQEEYQEELRNILLDIHSMASAIKSEDDIYREYESIYREMLVYRYSKVELIGAGINNNRNVTRYDISLAYVELTCINWDSYGDEIEMSQVFDGNDIVWIKGEAGAGKTTFLQWVAICAARNDIHQIDHIQNKVPIVIELRNAKYPIKFQDAVNQITAGYGRNCPDGWIGSLLEKDQILLLFDGLDEIAWEKRQEVYDLIEDVTERYPGIKILLTARNSVKDDIGCDCVEYEIQPMDMEHIKEFIEYWHRSVLRRDAVVENVEIQRLQRNLKQKVAGSPQLKVLARNPLLCAMICALNYVNDEQLPEDKMELYEKCCEMLMDARDAQRKIDSVGIYKKIPKLDYSRKRKMLEEMAYWMMNMGESSARKANVIYFLEHLLRDTTFISDKKDEYSAEQILDFLIERSGIIREPQEGYIDFIHKTFMEFLSVKAICRNCGWSILVREACNVTWKETIVMCFREMGRDNVKDILEQLVRKGEESGDERYILIASLGAANAIFLPDDEIKREIDKKIGEMIPPSIDDVTDMAQAGEYLLPFLEDSDRYTQSERQMCLRLLDRLDTPNAIPDILSYISGNASDTVKGIALDMLCMHPPLVLEEYNVREQLINILTDAVKGTSLTTYESMLDIIGGETLWDRDKEKIRGVKDLKFICGKIEECEYTGNIEFFENLCECQKVVLEGNVRHVGFLCRFKCVEDLSIRATEGDLSDGILELSDLKNLSSLKHLYIQAKTLKDFYENDIRNMKNLETFELHCQDPDLELDLDGFSRFPRLKKVVFDVNEEQTWNIMEWKQEWKRRCCDLEVVINSTCFYDLEDGIMI